MRTGESLGRSGAAGASTWRPAAVGRYETS